MREKVLILGGSGYIGARLSSLLSQKYFDITILDLKIDGKLDTSKIRVIESDITKESVIDVITDQYYDVVINLISLDHYKSQNYKPSIVNNINVLPTWNLLNSFLRKKNIKKYINFSTIHVYSNTSIQNQIAEDSEVNPTSVYGLTHLMSENITNYFGSNPEMCSINLRLSNSYGDPYLENKDCWNLVINNLCLTAFECGKIELKSSLKNTRNFIHYLDICRAVEMMIDSKFTKSGTYNLCSDISTDFEQLIKIIVDQYENIFNKKLDLVILNESGKLQQLNYSNLRLKRLNFESIISIEEGISKLFYYLRDEYKGS
jgi:UDP-glucose 4-epimerase